MHELPHQCGLWIMHVPRNDLACHLIARVCTVSRETEIGNFELSIGGDEQVVWLQVLYH